ncbi:MAG: ATP-binding protein [Candidatus Fermentibacteraceae bacterium]|nr:ATP-binding protein [Candidatus Fermentibacteraceae bacterium]MBN2608616.1 ATP-binding protein [Candidatus Fermentibacteraceae bacterium]
MKQVVVLSGKGGTGKTSLTASLAHLASMERSLVLADTDVDAANLELLLRPERVSEFDFTGGFKALIQEDICTGCGTCMEVCRFHAVRESPDTPGGYIIDRIACEGCNACVHQCPVRAISSKRVIAGRWFISDSPYGPLFHAEMKAGEENSGKLVSTVKKAAVDRCGSTDCGLLLVDGPPGIGCPVIASCAGADLAVIVTEPGVSAIHDLRRILKTVDHFGVRPAVCINKSDINLSRSSEIMEFCDSRSIPLLGMIPFDPVVTTSMSGGYPVTEFDSDTPASVAAGEIWKRLSSRI